jgi:hypothetical protein
MAFSWDALQGRKRAPFRPASPRLARYHSDAFADGRFLRRLPPSHLCFACGCAMTLQFAGQEMVMRRAACLIALTCFARSAPAAPPPDADPALAPWFNSLRQPWTNALCCSVADCRPVPSRLNDGHYEAFIDGEWRQVPDRLILNRNDNPTGRAVACWTPRIGILCFVRAPES